MKYLGIDYGTKWVGVAISDDEGSFAFPVDVWRNTRVKDIVEKLLGLVAEKKVAGIVLGKSVNLTGEDNELMVAIRTLQSALEKAGMTVYLQDETYTTAQSRRLHQQREPRSRKALKKERLDAAAAALILQGWLDRSDKQKS